MEVSWVPGQIGLCDGFDSLPELNLRLKRNRLDILALDHLIQVDFCSGADIFFFIEDHKSDPRHKLEHEFIVKCLNNEEILAWILGPS